MSDPILVEPSDLDLYASAKVHTLQAKIKGCVPEKLEYVREDEVAPDMLELLPGALEGLNKRINGYNQAIDRLTANLIAAGLLEEEKL